MEEPKYQFGYDEKIPEKISEIFIDLCQDLSLIQGKLDLYKILYDPKNLELLNMLAPYAFSLIEESLFEDILISIFRLGDNTLVCGKKTIGFRTLVLESDPIPQINEKLSDFQNLYEPFKKLRNKHIAHKDYDIHTGKTNYELLDSSSLLSLPTITVEMIDEILKCGEELLITVTSYYSGADIYFHPISSTDGKELLQVLKIAYQAIVTSDENV
jgi:hypothetical protein